MGSKRAIVSSVPEHLEISSLPLDAKGPTTCEPKGTSDQRDLLFANPHAHLSTGLFYKMFVLMLSSTQRMQFPSASPESSWRWSTPNVSAVTLTRWSSSSFMINNWHEGTTLSTRLGVSPLCSAPLEATSLLPRAALAFPIRTGVLAPPAL